MKNSKVVLVNYGWERYLVEDPKGSLKPMIGELLEEEMLHYPNMDVLYRRAKSNDIEYANHYDCPQNTKEIYTHNEFIEKLNSLISERKEMIRFLNYEIEKIEYLRNQCLTEDSVKSNN